MVMSVWSVIKALMALNWMTVSMASMMIQPLRNSSKVFVVFKIIGNDSCSLHEREPVVNIASIRVTDSPLSADIEWTLPSGTEGRDPVIYPKGH